MDNKQVNKKIKEAFNSEVPDILSNIKSSPDFRVPPSNNKFNLKNVLKRRLIMTLSSMFVVIILLGIVVGRTNYVVASTVTLDINPSIEITLNRNDYVIGVTALNDDGIEVIDKNIKYRGLSIDEALEIIITKLNELGYVVDTSDENNVVLVTVESNNEERKTKLVERFNTRIQNELDKYNDSHWVFNSEDFNLTEEQIRQIKNHDLMQKYSLTKIALAYRINELDPELSLRELSRLPVRQLYNLYIELEDPANLPKKDQMPPPRHHHQP